MTGQKLQALGENIDEQLGSLLSMPGAFGNIAVGVARQVRLVDVVVFALMVSGWGWLVFGYALNDNDDVLLILLALLPTVVWLICGVIGGLFFEISGLGWRSLALWESYLLLIFFIFFGLITLRIAFNPRERRVYRGSAPKQGA